MTVLDHVQIAIPEGGEEAGRSFYGRILGLPEIPEPAPLAGRGGCWFAIGGQQLHLGVEKDFRPARKAHVALAVESLTRLRGFGRRRIPGSRRSCAGGACSVLR